jgi:hypothetical protein
MQKDEHKGKKCAKKEKKIAQSQKAENTFFTRVWFCTNIAINFFFNQRPFFSCDGVPDGA